ncbi:MAG: LutC/YkgG family protein, partial [Acidimicrobiales bacterium]
GGGGPAAVGLGGAPRPATPEEAAEQLCAALAQARATGHLCESAETAMDLARELCGDRAVAIEDHPDLSGLAASLRVVDDPWEAEVGVTGVELAMAETGTLAMVASPARPRSTSLVPPAHVALVPFSRLVPTFAEGVARLAALDPRPSNISFVTGISRSSDIEMRTVYGVHGPGRVDVLVYPDGDRQPAPRPDDAGADPDPDANADPDPDPDPDHRSQP